MAVDQDNPRADLADLEGQGPDMSPTEGRIVNIILRGLIMAQRTLRERGNALVRVSLSEVTEQDFEEALVTLMSQNETEDREIDRTLDRLGSSIERQHAELDQLLVRLRTTRVFA
jgi:hypothetical protein